MRLLLGLARADRELMDQLRIVFVGINAPTLNLGQEVCRRSLDLDHAYIEHDVELPVHVAVAVLAEFKKRARRILSHGNRLERLWILEEDANVAGEVAVRLAVLIEIARFVPAGERVFLLIEVVGAERGRGPQHKGLVERE